MRTQSYLRPIPSHLVARGAGTRDVGRMLDENCVPRSVEFAADRAIVLVRRAMTCLESDHQAALRCLHDASTLLGGCVTQSEKTATGISYDFQPGGLVRWQASRALAYIEENLGSKIGIGELAALVSLSQSRFSHAFKRSLGLPPMAYVVRRRVERAKVMMISTAEHLTEVALACGFADQSHFIRSFRRIIGTSPGVWRRTNSVA